MQYGRIIFLVMYFLCCLLLTLFEANGYLSKGGGNLHGLKNHYEFTV